MSRILTVDEMRYCEKRSDELGVSLGELMDNAGRALADKVGGIARRQGTSSPVFVIGTGNNGGDGLVAARLLYQEGMRPAVVCIPGMREPKTDLALAAYRALPGNIMCTGFDRAVIENAQVLVDCIFGTGFHGEIREEMLPVMEAMEASRAVKLACDIPSGADARSGQVSRGCFKADMTLTMHSLKLGLLMSPAREMCGEIEVCDIGIPEEVHRDKGVSLPRVELFDEGSVQALLPSRPAWGHKGTFGRAVCVCGSRRYIGAAGLSVTAAMRTGAGLTELCTLPEVIGALAGRMYECIYTPLEGRNGVICEKDADTILERCQGAGALLVGCGLGHNAGTEELLTRLVEQAEIPLIIDADGINSLAANIDVLSRKKTEVILTPHPGELGRLCGITAKEAASDPLGYAMELCSRYGVTVVAKGAETLVCSGNRATVMRFGNTALAKGGSGDMLAGIITSLAAQGCEPERAGALGCYILGSTAEMLSERLSQRGIIARDILQGIPELLGRIEGR